MRGRGLLVGLLLLLTACAAAGGGSAGDAVGVAPGAGAAPASAPDDRAVLQHYLEVFATADAARLRADLVPLTAPGSPARRWSEHQAAFRQALEDSGSAPPRQDTVEATDGGARICTPGGGVPCREYTDARTQDGLLADFAVEGDRLDGHLAESGGRAEAGGLAVTLVSGYQTPRRALFVCLQAKATGGVPVGLQAASASYTGPDGTSSNADEAQGAPGPVAPGAERLVCARVPEAAVGGTLHLGVTPAGAPARTTLDLPVPAAAG